MLHQKSFLTTGRKKVMNRPLNPEENNQLRKQGEAFLTALEVLNEKIQLNGTSSADARYLYWVIRCLIDQAYKFKTYDPDAVQFLYQVLNSGEFRRLISPLVGGSRTADQAITTLESMAAQGLYLP